MAAFCPAMSQAGNTALLKQYRIPYVILERSFPESISSHHFVGHDNYRIRLSGNPASPGSRPPAIAYSGWDSPIRMFATASPGYQAALISASRRKMNSF